MFAQQESNRRRFFGLAALSLAGAWIATRDSVQLITMKPFRLSGASDLASLGRATAWLNSPPLTAADLQGKVVLVDFWTYTCINWLRTVPYVRTCDGPQRREASRTRSPSTTTVRSGVGSAITTGRRSSLSIGPGKSAITTLA